MRLYEISRGSYSDRQHAIWWGPDDYELGEAQVFDAVREACPWEGDHHGGYREGMWNLFQDDEEPGIRFVAALRSMGWHPAVLSGVLIDEVPPSAKEVSG